MIKDKKSAATCSKPDTPVLITAREKSAMRYMAGYIAVKLIRKYSIAKPSAPDDIKHKRKLILKVLHAMKAEDQPVPNAIDSISDYSRLWSDLIDRGGLYHINDDVSFYVYVMLST
jgi:hypothetical protein